MSVAQRGERDTGLLGLVERLLGKPAEAAKPVASPAVAADDGLGPLLPADSGPALLEPQLTIESVQRRTAPEIADIILRALHAIEGCPARGFEVTVYGGRHWNAMLRITPAAGGVDAPAWRARVRAMAHVLRGQYDVVD